MTRRQRRAFALEDVLAPLRALETNDGAVVLLGDDDVFRVLIAWQNCDQSWTKPTGDPPTAQHGKIAALWSWIRRGWEIDEEEIASICGLGIDRVHEKLGVLVGNRMVYPDGSIAKAARAALMAHTAAKLGMKQKTRRPMPAKGDDDGDDETN